MQHHQQPQQQQQQQQRGEDTNFIRQTLISHSNTNNTLNKQRVSRDSACFGK